MIHFCVLALFVCLLSVHLDGAPARGEDAKSRARAERTNQLQRISDRLRLRLGIMERVMVTLAKRNPLVMSVETLGTRSGPFVINADEAFIATLTDDEIEAAIAHELGHVWIYTHHPYEQSERYANDIALRVINRAALEPVYAKVWKRTGIKGNLAEYIGDNQQ
jgi:hypothetical protein